MITNVELSALLYEVLKRLDEPYRVTIGIDTSKTMSRMKNAGLVNSSELMHANLAMRAARRIQEEIVDEL